jgi:hypothetical protein
MLHAQDAGEAFAVGVARVKNQAMRLEDTARLMAASCRQFTPGS